MHYIALGDCVTLGTPYQIGAAYPERVGLAKNWCVTNYGHTMATTREGLEYFKKADVQQAHILSIQFGMVDSWETFTGSPYVKYYPDNWWRKLLRKLVKKIKKCGRRFKFHNILGVRNVVELPEYIKNIECIIQNSRAKYIILPEIYPNLDGSREQRILTYNRALHHLHDGKRVFVVKCFDLLKINPNGMYYDDQTHLSDAGHQVVADEILKTIQHLS